MALRVPREVRSVYVVDLGGEERSSLRSTRRLEIGRRRRRSRGSVRRRRVSRALRPQERATRRMIRAVEVGARELLRRHDRSTRRRRNGFIRDYSRNVARAQEKAMDVLIPE
jgi:Family of unknown function (DUF6312)